MRAPCPQCNRGPRDAAVQITRDDRGERRHCHRCEWWQLKWTGTCRQQADAGPCGGTMDMVTDANGTSGRCSRCCFTFGAGSPSPLPIPFHAPTRMSARTEPLDWSARAESIWRRTQTLRGTLGEVYLHHRGCVLPPRDSHLRFLPGDGRYPPSLCAAITDIRTAKPISLHFTRLAADGRGKAGTDRDKLLLAGHRKKGGCIRLWPDEAVTDGLAIAEGIESALAAAHAYAPVWTTIDAGNLAAFPVLAGIETLVIFHDADDRGIEAGAECAARRAAAQKEVVLVSPSRIGTDINDEVNA